MSTIYLKIISFKFLTNLVSENNFFVAVYFGKFAKQTSLKRHLDQNDTIFWNEDLNFSADTPLDENSELAFDVYENSSSPILTCKAKLENIINYTNGLQQKLKLLLDDNTIVGELDLFIRYTIGTVKSLATIIIAGFDGEKSVDVSLTWLVLQLKMLLGEIYHTVFASLVLSNADSGQVDLPDTETLASLGVQNGSRLQLSYALASLGLVPHKVVVVAKDASAVHYVVSEADPTVQRLKSDIAGACGLLGEMALVRKGRILSDGSRRLSAYPADASSSTVFVIL